MTAALRPLAVLLSAGALAAQTPTETPLPASTLDLSLQQWRAAHGEAWQIVQRPETGWAEFVYGGNAQPDYTPRTEVEFFDAARAAVAATAGLHGVEVDTLTDDRVLAIPLAHLGTTDKTTVRFRQEVGGVPVTDGWVNALFGPDGELLSIQTTAAVDLDQVTLQPTLDAASAARRAATLFEETTGLAPLQVADPELSIGRLPQAETEEALLTWRVSTRWSAPDTAPMGYTFVISASDGRLVDRHDDIHHFDVSGTVTTLASPGVLPDIGSNPEVTLPMIHANVSSDQGIVQTDENGNFNFPGVSTITNVVVRYVGTYADSRNQGGGNHNIQIPSLSGSGNVIALNTAADEYPTAEANAFLSITDLRNWIRSVNPNDDTADFRATARVNINSSCNAFYDGGSVNFYRAQGNCVNSAYSTVASHEMGHWLNDLYGTGNGADGMGEGNADVFAMYLDDTPIVGENWTNGGGFIRTGTNNNPYCGDLNSACYGGVHANGQPWMGAAWKVRTNLKNSLGTQLGGDVADALFLGWMNSYNQTSIRTIIETQWLTLDDDDGNIVNGTPNYADIDGGFVQQGWYGIPLPTISIVGLTNIDHTTDEVGPYTVQADIDPVAGNSITSATLFYRVDAGSWNSLPMTPIGGGLHTADIPGIAGLAAVDYYVEATDNLSNTVTKPDLGPARPRNFDIGDVRLLFRDRFTSDKNWVITDSNVTTGSWSRGAPAGTVTDQGVFVQPSQDHSIGARCYLTENGPLNAPTGENDVDGGPTVLTSPSFDLQGWDGFIRYAYWIYNNDNDDSLIVEVSNDGNNWTEVTRYTGGTGGWFESSFRISNYVSPTSTIHVRFIAADQPNNSITEAAVDDLEVYTTEPAPPTCDAEVFCESLPNSTGISGQFGTSGSTRISNNNLTFLVTNLPPETAGVFICSPDPISVPFGDGNLCLGNQTLGFVPRLDFAFSDDFGIVIYNFDNTNPPVPEVSFDAGETWYFQYWHRDNDAMQSGFNFSDALQVYFCP